MTAKMQTSKDITTKLKGELTYHVVETSRRNNSHRFYGLDGFPAQSQQNLYPFQ